MEKTYLKWALSEFKQGLKESWKDTTWLWRFHMRFLPLCILSAFISYWIEGTVQYPPSKLESSLAVLSGFYSFWKVRHEWWESMKRSIGE